MTSADGKGGSGQGGRGAESSDVGIRDHRETQTSRARLAGRVGAELIRIYNRHEIASATLPSGPVLFVANHGAGRPAIAGRSWADEARTGRYERAHTRPVS